MCTVSLVASGDFASVRLLMNRDEQRTRATGLPPRNWSLDGADAIWPVDPRGGGTWVAATDRGLVFALLNLAGERRGSGHSSRGAVIPALASSPDLDAVADRWSTLETASYAPFRLIVATLTEVSVFTRGARLPHRRPLATSLYCSSSLGDEIVTEPRRSLFAGLLATSHDPWHAQDRLHQHAWPDRRHLSVLMSRTDAATVSRTEVVLDAGRVSMRYAAVIDGWPAAIGAPPLALSRGRVAA